MMLAKLLWIALGGALGTLARYGTSVALKPWSETFPFGTLALNLLGCLLIGVLHGMFADRWIDREDLRLALTVGFLGGFTTFSTFALDNTLLLTRGSMMRPALNILASNVLGIALVFAGLYIARARQ